ncbi:MAG: TetR/AcrR family transcriptional regulator [Acidimicrobiales bacterium]
MDAPRTARARARIELTSEIRDVARRQLAEHGADGLSLRAVSREMGMVSSALYRYYPSREELLTALIIDAYNAVGEAAECAAATRPSGDTARRWMAVGRAVRAWALAHPHEYALVYGSPVPGYRAPPDTVDPAIRVMRVLGALLSNAQTSAGPQPVVPVKLRRDLDRVRAVTGPGVPDGVIVRGLVAWTQLFGAISFELFGHFHNAVDETAVLFDHMLELMGAFVGFGPSQRGSGMPAVTGAKRTRAGSPSSTGFASGEERAASGSTTPYG